jgi:homoserine kinase
VRAKVPGSAANLGPGFDALALALDRYVEVEIVPADALSLQTFGEGAGQFEPEEHLAVQVAQSVIGHNRFSVTVVSQVPLARGLGSSAALAVAAAAAAGSPDPLGVAVALEGHPENAAASVVGGLISACMVDGQPRVVKLPLDPSLNFVLIVPDRTLKTKDARAALGETVPREDATFNLGRLGLLLAGLADARFLVPEAADDRLHQRQRTPLFPESPALLAALNESGALASCWSGAGPSLLGIATADHAGSVADGARRAMEREGVPGSVSVLNADLHGLVLGAEPLAREI